MKSLMISSLFAVGMLGMSACTAPQHKVEPSAVPAASSDAQRMAERFCVRSTGSRIVARQKATENGKDFDKRCLGVNGRVYTREDIERTGEVDLADALRKLDPAIY
ncbi:MAG TPA: hypothetical protein VIK70_03785 [Lysobacter sp.]